LKIVALVLLLAFCQRLGASLWVHHIYHEARAKMPGHQPGYPQWGVRCDCLDDAFMPLEGAQTFQLFVPSPEYQLIGATYLPTIAQSASLESSLRGPPPPSAGLS
jgi:hypothetical protein